MAFSLFAPPTTDWAVERRNREAELQAEYNRAAALANRDALTAARGAALPGRGAAAARDAVQAMSPEIARIRAEEANRAGEIRGQIRGEMRAEVNEQNAFWNNLIGGLAGIAGQVGVPLISSLTGNSGAPADPAAATTGALASAEAAMTGAAPGAVAGATPLTRPARADRPMGTLLGGDVPGAGGRTPEEMGDTGLRLPSSAAPVVGPDGLTDEERRRRAAMGGGGGLGGMMGAAAPIAGMANPLAGLALGAGSRLFG
ncbi:MAG: hypothetical protein KA761_11830 [Gemmatimonadaceae bacterium]|nr:hypothetical protein [Gemmatimonadaceae bacterium]